MKSGSYFDDKNSKTKKARSGPRPTLANIYAPHPGC